MARTPSPPRKTSADTTALKAEGPERSRPQTRTSTPTPSAKPIDPHAPITEAERGLLSTVDGSGLFDALHLSEAERVVRSVFLRALLTNRIAGKSVPDTGLVSWGLIFEEMLDLSSISLTGSALPSLALIGAAFKRGAVLDDACIDSLILNGSSISGGIRLQRARIKGNAKFDRLTCEGGFDLLGAEVGGQLILNGARLKGAANKKGQARGYALSADGIVIKGDVFCGLSDGHRFEADGEVRFLGAEIGGQLSFCGARLKGSTGENGQISGRALSVDQAIIKGGVFCDLAEGHRFEADGQFGMLGAEIGGQLSLSGAQLKGSANDEGSFFGDALSAQGAIIKRETFLDDALTASGRISFRGACLSGLLIDGRFTGNNPDDIALDLRDAKLHRLIVSKAEGLGKLNLEGATADTFDGFGPDNWGERPTATEGLELDLDGFIYRRAEFGPAEGKPRHRQWAKFVSWDTHALAENVLELLDREFREGSPQSRHYFPQPFEQAARVLREAGYDREANAVAVAKREFKRGSRAGGWRDAFLGGLSCLFFRHGYGPMRATFWMIVFVAIGGGAVWLAQAYDILVVLAPPGQTVARCGEVPLAYALDAFLPLVDLGVDKQCRVDLAQANGWWVEALRVTYAILGWLFVPMVALTYAGVLRKD